MKKSLVAVLLSLVALTVVAGAAFAGTSFDIEAKVDGTAQKIEVKDWKEASADVKAGTAVADITFSTTKEAIELTAQTSVEFAIASPDQGFKLSVYPVKSDKTLDAAKSGAITETGEFVLAAASGDIVFAFNAKVTISGSPEEKGNPTTVSKVSDKALEAATKKFPAGTKMFGADDFESELTSPDYAAIKSDIANKKIKLYTTPAKITQKGAVVFKIKLSSIKAKRVLSWYSLKFKGASDKTVSISEATEIGTVYYFDDDSGKEIMLNDTTTADDQTVDVAFAVEEGRQVFGVADNDPKNGGGSPSSGCDMGLLSGVALFAVALLSLRKSR